MKICKVCNKEILSNRAKIYCSNACKFSDAEYNKKRYKKRDILDKSKKIVCKIDGKEFKDIDNRSGALSRHLKSIGVVYENVFDYYNVVENKNEETKKWNCKYCDWTTKDVKNVSGCITTHIKSKHDISPSQHVLQYPEDYELWMSSKTISNGDIRHYELNKDTNNFIECLECGEKMIRITKTHLNIHNMSVEEYRKKYDLEGSSISSLNFSNKMRKNYYENIDSINKITKSSAQEKEIRQFLEDEGIEYETSNRKIIFPQELDVYIPSKKIAIEINGLFWHSEKSGNKLKDYHIQKTEACEKIGIKLIHVFDDEWKNKKEIVKSKLKSILGLQKEKIYARQCEIKKINSQEKSKFLKQYHIQSDDRSKYLYGLYYKEDLVSVMTFCELRAALGQKKKNGHFELSRYASKIRVVGGASKLLSYFIKQENPQRIITYADRRFTSTISESMYEKLGFSKIKHTKPNYWYTKDYAQKYHRYNFTKSAIVKKYGLDPKKTEFDLMKELGYDKIWDCGNIRYELNIAT